MMAVMQWLYYITMAVLGVADAGLNTQLYAVLGSFFPRDPDAAFACTFNIPRSQCRPRKPAAFADAAM